MRRNATLPKEGVAFAIFLLKYGTGYVVPEPSSLSLKALAAPLLLARRRYGAPVLRANTASATAVVHRRGRCGSRDQLPRFTAVPSGKLRALFPHAPGFAAGGALARRWAITRRILSSVTPDFS
jgi:hypothetical protein